MPDIESRNDLEQLMTAFYAQAINDAVIGHFFTEVVKLNLKHHIPLIVDFWESVLLNGTQYQRNAMQPHMRLHQLSPMEPQHFSRWLQLFEKTVDAMFAGEKAELAKQRAQSIATLMQIKIAQLPK